MSRAGKLRPNAHWKRIAASAAFSDKPIADVLTGDDTIDHIIRAAFAKACRRRDARSSTREARA